MAAGRQRKEPDTSTYSGRLAARIRELRDRAGLSVEDAVELMEVAGFPVKARSWYYWESGSNSPPVDAIPAIACTLKLKTVRALLPPS